MEKYIKNGEIKTLNGILVKQEVNIGDNVYYKFSKAESVDDVLKDGWILYEDLEDMKQDLLESVNKYDKSENVNSFIINGISAWIDRDTRVSLMNSTNILKNADQETTTLWLNNTPYVLNCDLLIQLLNNLEIYALQCYNVTEQHKANISKLEIEELKSYDFTTNYPEKLNITL